MSPNLLGTRAGRREKQEKNEVRESGRASLPTLRIRPNFRSVIVKGNGNPAPGPEGSPHPISTDGGVGMCIPMRRVGGGSSSFLLVPRSSDLSPRSSQAREEATGKPRECVDLGFCVVSLLGDILVLMPDHVPPPSLTFTGSRGL